MHVAREISEPCNPCAAVSLIKIRGRMLITQFVLSAYDCIVLNLDFVREKDIKLIVLETENVENECLINI